MRYEHFIAVDWAQRNRAIARMTAHSDKISVIDIPSSIKELRIYLEALKGRKILTIEESHTAQWLYTELKESVDELIVCDPYRNRLLSEGPKTDKIDARKLVQLLRANLLKPVFHSGDEFIVLRKLVSGYQDVIRSGVRMKNQRDALFRSVGKRVKSSGLEEPAEQFVLDGLNRGIEAYEQERERYQAEFSRLGKNNLIIRHLKTIPGIGEIGAVKIVAIVVDPRRFKRKSDFLSYCGLIKLERTSGGKSYVQKTPRYCRQLKDVFKIAALSNIFGQSKGSLKNYYEDLIQDKGYSAHNARHAVARRIAILSLGTWKSGKKFIPQGGTRCSQLTN